MSEIENWQQRNARCLSASLVRLRDRLERFAQNLAPASDTNSPVSATPGAAEGDQPPPALAELGRRLGLSPFEQQILLLCAAMELDTRIPALCARAQNDPQKPFPTYALALSLFANPAWDALSPDRPLRYWRLLEVSASGAQPLTASALRADERVVHYLKGLNLLDDRLAELFSVADREAKPELAPSQLRVADALFQAWQAQPTNAPLPAAQLLGLDGGSKQLVAQWVAAQLGRSLMRLSVEALPSGLVELEAMRRLWQRESLLLPLALFLDAQEIESAPADRLQVLERFVGRIDGVVFLAVREPLPLPTRTALTFEVTKPDIAEQRAGWAEALGPDGAQTAAILAGQFSFNLPRIKSLAQVAREESQRTERALEQVAWEACASSARGRLGALAQALEPKVSWDDLVLPEPETRLLRQIAVQVRHRAVVYSEWGFDRKMNRGFGISALFAGESGTGKTMAADVIANELHLSLYRIDLSAVVNKYIGETEKNLRRLFDAAEGSGAILFFDEADALFGKRSEVKDSHDRYANIEINYLLQRIESYRGLAILATNLKNSLDTAFLRRLRFVVNFPFPDLAHRRLLWEKSFPRPDAAHGRPGVPVDDLDYERLARFNLSGGHIHNIALNAAFLAAEAGTPVTMPLVLEAARGEFLKLERPINSAEFHWPERNGARHLDQTLKVTSVL